MKKPGITLRHFYVPSSFYTSSIVSVFFQLPSSMCVRGSRRVHVLKSMCNPCVYMFPAALPVGMQHGSSEKGY